ncbi:FAD synthetase, chloroplastic [Glycine soja]|uniref:FAD synthetase, chloroplastic n=1 Tax=Glycine soja TaxID=3848 RepID=A0A445F3A4_GLYSO|nr:FAD synthetase, chloroplastic [Glycine soja]
MNVKFSPTEHLLWQDFSLVHLMPLLPFFICMSNCVIENLQFKRPGPDLHFFCHLLAWQNYFVGNLGENYQFGYKAAGDALELVKLCEEYGMEAYIIKSVME